MSVLKFKQNERKKKKSARHCAANGKARFSTCVCVCVCHDEFNACVGFLFVMQIVNIPGVPF